jgi:chemotaxis protein methyltransferase CheR
MLDGRDFEPLKRFVLEETGLAYYQSREAELRRKVGKAARQAGARDYSEYLSLLRDEGGEGGRAFDELVSELTIGETHFFRDEALFKAVQEVVLPAVIEKNRGRKRLWIWSAGCATGEEVYTLAIVLHTHFAHQLAGWDVRITGTDINRSFLGRAMRGVYGDWSFRGVSGQVRPAHFIPQGKNWRIRPMHQQGTVFQYHNLVKMPFPSVFHNLSAFDIIFCRNVMLYLDEETIRRIIRQFQQTLVPDGWLVVGHADHNIKYFKTFKTVMQSGTSLYQNSAKPDKAVEKIEWPCQNLSLPDLKELSPDHFAQNCTGDLSSLSFTKKSVTVEKKDKTRDHRSTATVSIEESIEKEKSIEKTAENGFSDKAALTSLINRGDWGNAKDLCKVLLSEKPLDAAVHLLSAFISEQEGGIDDALDSLKKALYLDRKFVVGHYHLGLMFQNLGDFKKAEKCFINVGKLLDDYDKDYIFEMADGISAGELKQLSDFHLEILNGWG